MARIPKARTVIVGVVLVAAAAAAGLMFAAPAAGAGWPHPTPTCTETGPVKPPTTPLPGQTATPVHTAYPMPPVTATWPPTSSPTPAPTTAPPTSPPTTTGTQTSSQLPVTGAGSLSWLLLAAGFAMVTGGIVVALSRRRRAQH